MPKTLLIINENRPMLFLLQTIFNKKYKVSTVQDAFSAMYELEKNTNIEVIIVDLDFHEQESWNFIHNVTSSSLYGNIPLIVLGSKNDDKTKIKCMEMGVVKYFFKPFHPLNLIETVDTLTGSFSVKMTSKRIV